MSNGAPKPLDESTLWRASAITALLNFGFVAATLVALYKASGKWYRVWRRGMVVPWC